MHGGSSSPEESDDRCLLSGCSAGAARLLLVQEKESELDHILSRGIDPSMIDPTQCHSHPKAPQQWPSKPELCKYVQQVRDQQAYA